MSLPHRRAALGTLALGLALAGCRACGDEGAEPREASAPTMPTGMLAPLPHPPATPNPGSAPERLAVARGKKGGEWAELQIARLNDAPDRASFDHWQGDSRFLSLDAMTLLHDPFARALPGFDLFLPRLFDRASLGRLRAELATLKMELGAMSNVGTAKARWGEVSTLVAALPDDTAWVSARAALIATIDELSGLATELEARGDRLWVLGI
jgi:hypothetical protein